MNIRPVYLLYVLFAISARADTMIGIGPFAAADDAVVTGTSDFDASADPDTMLAWNIRVMAPPSLLGKRPRIVYAVSGRSTSVSSGYDLFAYFTADRTGTFLVPLATNSGGTGAWTLAPFSEASLLRKAAFLLTPGGLPPADKRPPVADGALLLLWGFALLAAGIPPWRLRRRWCMGTTAA